MKVYLYELSEEPSLLHYTDQDAWVSAVVDDTQETKPSTKPKHSVDLEFRKSMDIVFLKGHLDLEVGLLCSRCANAFDYHVKGSFQSMFTREIALGHQPTNVGVAHSEPTGATGEESEIEVLEKDYIELEDVLREQIYLKIPVQPLCKESCKGICPVCGQDQNTHPCQCHRLKNTALANALRNILK